MTFVRLSIAALALGACAAPGLHAPTQTTPSTYRLCADPQFESMCTPASLETDASEPAPIQIDTNLKTPTAKRTASLG